MTRNWSYCTLHWDPKCVARDVDRGFLPFRLEIHHQARTRLPQDLLSFPPSWIMKVNGSQLTRQNNHTRNRTWPALMSDFINAEIVFVIEWCWRLSEKGEERRFTKFSRLLFPNSRRKACLELEVEFVDRGTVDDFEIVGDKLELDRNITGFSGGVSSCKLKPRLQLFQICERFTTPMQKDLLVLKKWFSALELSNFFQSVLKHFSKSTFTHHPKQKCVSLKNGENFWSWPKRICGPKGFGGDAWSGHFTVGSIIEQIGLSCPSAQRSRWPTRKRREMDQWHIQLFC